jgi:hypothetical protein
MGKFTVIPSDTFQGLQLDAGVLLKRFNPDVPVEPEDSDIVCATTGGIQASCVPTFSDQGEDIDNVPLNMMELKHLDSWECKLSTTSLGTKPELIKLALGCADLGEGNASKIIPRADLKQTDFTDLWWVGDRADGGLVAIKLKNALATSGFSIQTTKNGKGQIAIELTGHVSINAQKEVPMEFYSCDPDETEYHKIIQNLYHVESSITALSVEDSTELSGTLTASEGYEITSVVVLMGNEDITSTAYTELTGEISISSVTNDVTIVATARAT